MKCPNCEGTIIENNKWFECENHHYDKESKSNTGSCDFAVYREVAGKKLSSKTFQKLLGGEVIFVEGLKRKNGEEFDTKLKLDAEEHKIVFVKDSDDDDAEEF
ncbi:MAG: topoisomerase C-terminal repeat-containing protein [Deltaproteobacteria bacterium]|jgi:hypothetical protein|nr:topoisomerase C-terminal repeat-containing protein [Deltaproteobacteria bacterium]MCL5880735.1 topoisomerase C-terminal repeat-containing protein [Deltaproteobacteria bacterium]